MISELSHAALEAIAPDFIPKPFKRPVNIFPGLLFLSMAATLIISRLDIGIYFPVNNRKNDFGLFCYKIGYLVNYSYICL